MSLPSQRLREERGIALIVVLWLTVLIAVIGSSFAYSMRGEALAARNTMSLAQARAAADGAVERTAFELSRSSLSPDGWAPDGQPHAWTDGDIALTSPSVIHDCARVRDIRDTSVTCRTRIWSSRRHESPRSAVK